MEGAIAKVKSANPDAFKSNDAEAKLREELKYLSSTIPVEERVAKAAKLAFANSIDSQTLAFKALASTQPTNNGSSTGTSTTTEADKNLDDMLKFLKIRK